MKNNNSQHTASMLTMLAWFILLLIFLSGCVNPGPQPAAGDSGNVTPYGDYNIKVIDNCEYIEYDAGVGQSSVYSLTHKGNCKFCLQRQESKL